MPELKSILHRNRRGIILLCTIFLVLYATWVAPSLYAQTQRKIYIAGWSSMFFTMFELDQQVVWYTHAMNFHTNWESFSRFDVVVLANIPYDENRALNVTQLQALRQYVDAGGNLIMTGGSYSFGSGNYNASVLREVLPVTITSNEDFIVTSSFYGNSSFFTELNSITFSSYNFVKPKPSAEVLATIPDNGAPLVVAGKFGKGNVIALTADDVVNSGQAYYDSNNWINVKKFFQNLFNFSVSNYALTDLQLKLILYSSIVSIVISVILTLYVPVKNWLHRRRSSNEVEGSKQEHSASGLGWKSFFIDVAILCLPILLLTRNWWLTSGYPLSWESVWYYGAVRALINDIRQFGQFPFWSSYLWGGSFVLLSTYPWVYPEIPYILVALVSNELVAFRLVVTIELLISAIGVYLLAYTITRNRKASVIGGISFVFCAYILVEAIFWGFVEILSAFMFMPYVFLAFLRLKDKKRLSIRSAGLFGFTVAGLVLSQPEIALFFILAFGVYALSFFFTKNKKSLWLNWILLVNVGVAVLWFLLLTSPWWVTFVFYSVNANYLVPPTFQSVDWSLPFSGYFIQTLAFRSSPMMPETFWAPGLGGILTWLFYLPLGLSLITIFLKRNRNTIFFTASLIFYLFFAMGVYAPLIIKPFVVFFNFVPGFQYIRTPGRALSVASLSASILISISLSYLGTIARPRMPSTLSKRKPLKKLLEYLVTFSLIILLIVGTFGEAQNQAQNWSPSSDVEEAYSWLSSKTGDFKTLMLPPHDTAVGNVPIFKNFLQNYTYQMFADLIHRYFTLQQGKFDIMGITAEQHVLFKTLSYTNLFDSALASADMYSLNNLFNYTWNLKYLVVWKDFFSPEALQKLLSLSDLRIAYQNQKIIILERVNAVSVFVRAFKHVIPVFTDSLTEGRTLMTLSSLDFFSLRDSPVDILFDPTNDLNTQLEDMMNSQKVIVLSSSSLENLLVTLAIKTSKNTQLLQAEAYADGKAWVKSSWAQPSEGAMCAGTTLKAQLDIPISIPTEERYDVWARIYCSTSSDRNGRITVFLDGQIIENDLPIRDAEGFRWIKLPVENMSPGSHKLSFLNDGNGPNDIDAIAITKATDFQTALDDARSKINAFVQNGGRIIKINEAEDVLVNKEKTWAIKAPELLCSRGWYRYLNGSATMTFNATKNGSYFLDLRVLQTPADYSPNRGNFTVEMDGHEITTFTPIGDQLQWIWKEIKIENVTAGNHEITFSTKKGVNDLDIILVTNEESSINILRKISTNNIVPLTYKRDGPGHYTITAETSTPMFISISEADFEGWKAFSSGYATNSISLNYMFTGFYINSTSSLTLTAGFEMPLYPKIAVTVSLICIVALILLLLYPLARKKLKVRGVFASNRLKVAKSTGEKQFI